MKGTGKWDPVQTMSWRIAIVFLGSVGIWLSALRLNELESRTGFLRLISALIVSVASWVLVMLVQRFLDHRSWSERPFLQRRGGWKVMILGFICWLLSAAIGVLISTKLGLTHITPQVPISSVVPKFFFLLVVVFLMEAFPEELISRGYIYANLSMVWPHWLSLLTQTALFTLFAYFVGSLYSVEQLLFIPGFGFLLGYFRVLTKDIWFSIGFHLALMTFTQLLSPINNLFVVSGSFFALRFFSFILLPSVISSVVLHLLYGNPDWDAREN